MLSRRGASQERCLGHSPWPTGCPLQEVTVEAAFDCCITLMEHVHAHTLAPPVSATGGACTT